MAGLDSVNLTAPATDMEERRGGEKIQREVWVKGGDGFMENSFCYGEFVFMGACVCCCVREDGV